MLYSYYEHLFVFSKIFFVMNSIMLIKLNTITVINKVIGVCKTSCLICIYKLQSNVTEIFVNLFKLTKKF